MAIPHITIITATLNCAGTLRDTLESVLAQTFCDYEYIVVDGGSQDETLKIIKEYEPRFSGKLKWTSEPDKNLYDALNKGIGMAMGDVVGILNADDFYSSPNILVTVARTMEDRNIEAVYGDVHYVRREETDKTVRYYSSRIFRPWLMRLGFMPAHPSFYCRRECFLTHGLYDTSFRVAADFELLLRIIYLGHIHMRYLPLDFVTMRRGGISSSGMRSYLQIMRDHLRALKKNGVYSNVLLLSLRYIYKVWELR